LRLIKTGGQPGKKWGLIRNFFKKGGSPLTVVCFLAMQQSGQSSISPDNFLENAL
jgi:hypothetical protein